MDGQERFGLTEWKSLSLDFTQHRFGRLQKSGVMSVLPLIGPDRPEQFATPLSGLKLSGVEGYGQVEMENRGGGNGDGGVGIVPLHIGYIQDGAQNHALCRSAFIGSGQKVSFRDACCVQESQGGYLTAAEQWFFVLPLPLREEALHLRGVENYGKLWQGISTLNEELGLPGRGHLEQIICRNRPLLTQFASRFELLAGQTGALFFLHDKLVGIEMAPNAGYFSELWPALVCFCYGVAAMQLESQNSGQTYVRTEPLRAANLDELRCELSKSRRTAIARIEDSLRTTGPQTFEICEEERYLDLQLSTALGRDFAGQIVQQQGRLVYASLFARRQYLYGIAA